MDEISKCKEVVSRLEQKCKRYEDALEAIYNEEADEDANRYIYNVDQIAGKALDYIK